MSADLLAQYLLLEYRIQHPLHGGLHVLDRIVDDAVQTDIHAFAERDMSADLCSLTLTILRKAIWSRHIRWLRYQDSI